MNQLTSKKTSLVGGSHLFVALLAILLVIPVHGQDDQSGDQNEKMGSSMATLDGLSDDQSNDLYESLVQRARFELGYRSTGETPPSDTESLTAYEFLERDHSETEHRELLIGLKRYPTRANELILRGRRTVEGKEQSGNPDLLTLQNLQAEIKKQLTNQDKKYRPTELEVEFYQLTNILPDQALNVLQSLGYNTSKPSGNEPIPYSNLPVVYPAPDQKQPNVVGKNQSELGSPTQSAPHNRLIFLHHSSQGEQILQLKRMLRNKVDVPSRQVLIESMVVELTEQGRRELGIEWEGANDEFDVEGTFQTNPTTGDTPLTISHDVFTSSVSMNKFQANLRALIKDDEAQVLSSPSVLTLNNTQASIEVVEEVPVFNTVFGGNLPNNVVEFNVKFKEVGITLNIKPRISKDSDTVAMQIQGEVSEAPRSEFIEIGGDPVAPLIDRRRVQTIARVDNNTPFIIGGLIRRRKSETVDRVPLLSEIPVIHPLFKVREKINERREAIIVLNPRVISPEGTKRPIKPKDSKRFDFLDNKLFRNTYRLKSGDVFDMAFIEQNEEIQRLMRRAKGFLEKNPDYRGKPPFDTLEMNRIPGEKAVIVRMLYEIAKKLNLTERVKLGNLIYFERDEEEPSGFDVTFLEGKLQNAGILNRSGKYRDRSYPRNMVVLEYDLQPEGDIQQISNTPVAEAYVKEVSSRDEAKQVLLDGNKLDGYERPATKFILDSKDDLTRLKAAILVREIIAVNDLDMRLDEFRVGRKIMIPEIEEDRIMLIDDAVSEHFFESEYYYKALKDKLRQYSEGLREILNERK